MGRILALFVLLLALTAQSASADHQRLEAEDIIQYGTYENVGGASIGLKSCQSASGGFGIGGVDYEGDYIVWFKDNDGPVLITDAGLISARTDGMTATYALMFEDESGTVLSADTLQTIPGTGVS